MFDILKGCNYLHTRSPPIIRRDIKPENILFYEGNKLKLADFGWSNMKDRVRTTFCGTPDYLAPEMVLERGHNEKLDVWTCGILCYELIIGNAPFTPVGNYRDKKEAQKMLEKNILELAPAYATNTSAEAKDLITALLRKKPQDRLSCLEALKHPWFVKHGLIFHENSMEGPSSQIFKNIHSVKSSKLGPKTLEADDDDVMEPTDMEENLPIPIFKN